MTTHEPAHNPAHESAATDGLAWVVAVFLLGLPSMLFVLGHVVAGAGAPEPLAGVLAWVLVITGTAGPVLTVAALALTIVLTFQRHITVPMRAAALVIALLSVLACLYMSGVPL